MKILREGSKNVYTPKREKIVGLGGGGGGAPNICILQNQQDLEGS